MHPVLVTVPGAFFKFLGPALIAWGIYSLVTSYRRRALAGPTASPRLPADTPANALISIAVGIALFVYAAALVVPDGNLAVRTALALRAFAGAVVDRNVWATSWRAIPIYSYGAMLGLSFVAGWFVSTRLADRIGLPREHVTDCFLFTGIAAIFGARLLYVLTNLHEFRDPETQRFSVATMFALRTGGLVAYGGFLGGALGSAIYLRRHRLSFWQWGDAAAPAVALGLAVTRIGCFLYGCDFGKPLAPDAPRWLRAIGTFPRWTDDKGSPAWLQHTFEGVRIDRTRCIERLHGDFHDGLCFLDRSARASVPVHPTQLYESVVAFGLVALLASVWRRGRRFDGQVVLAAGIYYGFARALLEILRDDNERGVWHGVSTSQFIGVLTAIVCAAVYARKTRLPSTRSQ
jgi:phosphatidylglycerol:prolipoprotein diacylglycerol transferase